MGKKKKKFLTPPEKPFTIKEYESSPYWKNKSVKFLEDKETKCYVCNRRRWKWMPRKNQWKKMYRFGVHHVRYTNVPNEEEGDLIAVCSCCHQEMHGLLRLRSLGGVYEELAQIVERYFPYEKDTYKKEIV